MLTGKKMQKNEHNDLGERNHHYSDQDHADNPHQRGKLGGTFEYRPNIRIKYRFIPEANITSSRDIAHSALPE